MSTKFVVVGQCAMPVSGPPGPGLTNPARLIRHCRAESKPFRPSWVFPSLTDLSPGPTSLMPGLAGPDVDLWGLAEMCRNSALES